MNIKKFSKKSYLILLLTSLLLLSGCPNNNDQNYPVSEEQYLLGWRLHNIDDFTPRQLSYSMKDLAVYNYSFNYPAASSRVYDNVMFWIAPFQNFAATGWVRFAVPQSRVYYLKGDPVSQGYSHGWSFYNIMQINYLTSDDFGIQFAIDATYGEQYKSENPFYAIQPIPGVKEEVYMGTSPFTPTSVVVKDEAISLNDHLIRGYNGKSYLLRSTKPSAWTSDGMKSIELPAPNYKIYLDDGLVAEGNLTLYDTWNYRVLQYLLGFVKGNYEVEINIPSGYPIFNLTKIKSSFNKNSEANNYRLPVLKHIEFPPRFRINESLPISLQFENEDTIKNVSMFYKTDVMEDWIQIDASTALVITDYSAKEINFKFDAATSDGTASYEIYPISLKAVKVFCSAEAYPSVPKDTRDSTNETSIWGSCNDEFGKGVDGLRVELYSGTQFLRAVKTSNGYYSAILKGKYPEVKPVFKGTGVYYQSQLKKTNSTSSEPIEP